MKSLADARLRRIRALELVAKGKSYQEVADEVGYSHRGSAHRAVFKALEEREVDGADWLRDLEVARLDRLQVALWDQALSGDVQAVASVVRIIEQRARLLGLQKSVRGTRRECEFAALVVGPVEGNPREAT